MAGSAQGGQAPAFPDRPGGFGRIEGPRFSARTQKRISWQPREARVGMERKDTPDWGRTCRVLAQSLKRYGAFHWTEIASLVGEDAYKDMQLQRENSRVWAFDLASVDPRPRRSILDHVEADGAELYGELSGHLEIGSPAGSNLDVTHMTCVPTPLKIETRTLAHTVDSKVLKDAPGSLLRDIVESFYSEITLQIENTAYSQLLKTDTRLLASVTTMEKRSDHMRIREEDPLDASTVASAAAGISRIHPRVQFPDGLVCLVSPAQATQLIDGSTDRAKAMSAGGVDLLVTPVIRFDQSYERHVAFVAAKRSIRVALSRVEVDVSRTDSRVRIAARYAVGAAVDPKQAARIESWRR